MTDIRVSSILPIARAEGAKSPSSDSDFLFSLQSVSASDVGAIGVKASTPKSTVKISDSQTRTAQSEPKSTAAEVRSPEVTSSDSIVKAKITQSSSQTATDVNSGKAQSIKVEAQQQTSPVRELQSTAAAQNSEKPGTELSGLQNQTVKLDGLDGLDGENLQAEAPKRPMLDLNRILERLGSFVGETFGEASEAVSDNQEILGAVEAVGNEAADDEAKLGSAESDTLETEITPVGVEEAVSFKSGENAPVIDLDRILEGIKSEETDEGVLTEAAEKKEPIAPIRVEQEYEPKQEQNVLPQINLDKILESVKGVQEGDEVIPSADRINAAEAEKPVKRDETAESERIAANVGFVWDNLAAAVEAASESLFETNLQASDMRISDDPTVGLVNSNVNSKKNTETVKSEDNIGELGELYGRFARRVARAERPATLEQLKAMLAKATRIAVTEANDPDRKAGEQEEMILKFLLEFLKKMNGDDADKGTSLTNRKIKVWGILPPVIKYLIEEVRDDVQMSDSKENAFEIAPMTALEAVGMGYETDTAPNGGSFVTTDSRTAEENKSEFGRTEALGMSNDRTELYRAEAAERTQESRTEIDGTGAAQRVQESRTVVDGTGAARRTQESRTVVDRTGVVERNQESRTVVDRTGAIERNQESRSVVDRTGAAERTQKSGTGTAEVRYAPMADGNAGKTVRETQSVNTVENTVEALSSLSISAGQAGQLSKAVEDPEDMSAKAMKVLSRPNRNGTIREEELPDEFAELKKLINDMKRTHEDEKEKDENDDEEEKEVGVGGKGVTGDAKSEIIRAISVKASEPGEAAVAKSFETDRSGAKQILSQIATEVLNNLPKEKRTVALVMTLTPENLGKVTLKITEQAGKLNVMVTAHSKETAEILASRMDGLQEALKDSGTQLEKYQVVYGPEHEADARQQNYEGSSKNPYVRQDDEEGTDEDGRFSELLKEAV